MGSLTFIPARDVPRVARELLLRELRRAGGRVVALGDSITVLSAWRAAGRDKPRAALVIDRTREVGKPLNVEAFTRRLGLYRDLGMKTFVIEGRYDDAAQVYGALARQTRLLAPLVARDVSVFIVCGEPAASALASERGVQVVEACGGRVDVVGVQQELPA